MAITATFGEEPLIQAWNGGHIKCVDLLLDIYSSTLFKTNSHHANPGNKILPSAIAHQELSEIIVRHYFINSEDSIDPFLETVVRRILKERLTNLIPNLIALFAEFQREKNQFGMLVGSHLLNCCAENDEDSVRWMWESELLRPHIPDFTHDYNPLKHLASHNASQSLARRLIRYGCPLMPGQNEDILLVDAHFTPLYAACEQLNQPVLEVLLEEKKKGRDIGINFRSPLSAAIAFVLTGDEALKGHKIRERKLVFIRTLIWNGANVTQLNLLAAPLFCSSSIQSITPEILRLLLNSYPDAKTRHNHCNLVDLKGRTPLSRFINDLRQQKSDQEGIEKLLILMQYGADPHSCLKTSSWSDEIKSALQFCCDFRRAVLKDVTENGLKKLQRQHPEGFSYLAQGILNNTLFINPDERKAVENLKPILKNLLDNPQQANDLEKKSSWLSRLF